MEQQTTMKPTAGGGFTSTTSLGALSQLATVASIKRLENHSRGAEQQAKVPPQYSPAATTHRPDQLPRSHLPAVTTHRPAQLQPSHLPQSQPSHLPPVTAHRPSQLPPSHLPQTQPSHLPPVTSHRPAQLMPSHLQQSQPSHLPLATAHRPAKLPPSHLPQSQPLHLPPATAHRAAQLPPSHLPQSQPSHLPPRQPAHAHLPPSHFPPSQFAAQRPPSHIPLTAAHRPAQLPPSHLPLATAHRPAHLLPSHLPPSQAVPALPPSHLPPSQTAPPALPPSHLPPRQASQLQPSHLPPAQPAALPPQASLPVTHASAGHPGAAAQAHHKMAVDQWKSQWMQRFGTTPPTPNSSSAPPVPMPTAADEEEEMECGSAGAEKAVPQPANYAIYPPGFQQYSHAPLLSRAPEPRLQQAGGPPGALSMPPPAPGGAQGALSMPPPALPTAQPQQPAAAPLPPPPPLPSSGMVEAPKKIVREVATPDIEEGAEPELASHSEPANKANASKKRKRKAVCRKRPPVRDDYVLTVPKPAVEEEGASGEKPVWEIKAKCLHGSWKGSGRDKFKVDREMNVASRDTDTVIERKEDKFTVMLFDELWTLNPNKSAPDRLVWFSKDKDGCQKQEVIWTKIVNAAPPLDNFLGFWQGLGEDWFEVTQATGSSNLLTAKSLGTVVKGTGKFSIRKRRSVFHLSAFGCTWRANSLDENCILWVSDADNSKVMWRRMVHKDEKDMKSVSDGDSSDEEIPLPRSRRRTRKKRTKTGPATEPTKAEPALSATNDQTDKDQTDKDQTDKVNEPPLEPPLRAEKMSPSIQIPTGAKVKI